MTGRKRKIDFSFIHPDLVFACTISQHALSGRHGYDSPSEDQNTSKDFFIEIKQSVNGGMERHTDSKYQHLKVNEV